MLLVRQVTDGRVLCDAGARLVVRWEQLGGRGPARRSVRPPECRSQRPAVRGPGHRRHRPRHRLRRHRREGLQDPRAAVDRPYAYRQRSK